jgi:hypothetical protein
MIETNIELILVDFFQCNGSRVFPGFRVVNITCSVRGQVCMAILKIRNLVFARVISSSVSFPPVYVSIATSVTGRMANSEVKSRVDVPLVEPHCILNKQQSLVRQEFWSEGRGEIYRL